MGKSRRANTVLFGFDFQVNAAIVLMLENIKELQSLKLDGKNEDIEIELIDNTMILAQAKSIVNSSSDFNNVRSNLKKALITLSECTQRVNARQLILITNSPNPFNDDASRSIFTGHAHRKFDTLPDSAKKIINDYLLNIDHPLDTSLFSVQVLPFETDDDRERYKIVQQEVNDFVENLKLTPGIGKKLLNIWQRDIFINGTKKDVKIVLDKKSVIWPLIVIETDIERGYGFYFEQFDTSSTNEIIDYYKEIIEYCSEKIEFFTKILYDFNGYEYSGKPSEKVKYFVDTQWENYLREFEMCKADNETKKGLIQIILRNIVSNRIKIDRIKCEVNL